jgi:hypothetical protein
VTRIKLSLGDREYVADIAELFTKMTIGEIRTIKRETGMTSDDLQTQVLALRDPDEDSENWDIYTSLVYLILSRSGGRTAWADVETIPLVDIVAGWSVIEDEPKHIDEVPLGELVMVDG